MIAKGVAVAAGREIFAEAQVILVDAAGVSRRLTVEAGEVAQHAPEPRADEVRRLGEQAEKIGARIFDPPSAKRHGEGHVGDLGLDAERPQEFDKIGVCSRVEDDEAGVDRDLALADGDENRVGMAAEAVRLLVNDHVVPPAEEPRGGEARDAGADNCDAKTSSGTHANPNPVVHPDALDSRP